MCCYCQNLPPQCEGWLSLAKPDSLRETRAGLVRPSSNHLYCQMAPSFIQQDHTVKTSLYTRASHQKGNRGEDATDVVSSVDGGGVFRAGVDDQPPPDCELHGGSGEAREGESKEVKCETPIQQFSHENTCTGVVSSACIGTQHAQSTWPRSMDTSHQCSRRNGSQHVSLRSKPVSDRLQPATAAPDAVETTTHGCVRVEAGSLFITCGHKTMTSSVEHVHGHVSPVIPHVHALWWSCSCTLNFRRCCGSHGGQRRGEREREEQGQVSSREERLWREVAQQERPQGEAFVLPGRP